VTLNHPQALELKQAHRSYLLVERVALAAPVLSHRPCCARASSAAAAAAAAVVWPNVTWALVRGATRSSLDGWLLQQRARNDDNDMALLFWIVDTTTYCS